MEYQSILQEYLKIFPKEKIRQSKFEKFICSYNKDQIIDWNNFNGHIVASGFLYSKKEKKFLILYHKDLNMFLYPGGHIVKSDKNPLQAAQREIREETGLINFNILSISENEFVPLDIDTHIIEYNSRLRLPEHYHFDFRYLFIIDEIQYIKMDEKEHSEYKWIGIDELYNDKNYGKIVKKIVNLI